MQQQMAAKQMELQERQTMVAEQRVQNDAMATQSKVELDLAKAEAQHAIQSDNQDLREAQFEHKQFIDESELEIRLRNTEDKTHQTRNRQSYRITKEFNRVRFIAI